MRSLNVFGNVTSVECKNYEQGMITMKITKMTRRIFRNNSPCPELGCDGKLKKLIMCDWPYVTSLECDKCHEDPRWLKNVMARKEREKA